MAYLVPDAHEQRCCEAQRDRHVERHEGEHLAHHAGHGAQHGAKLAVQRDLGQGRAEKREKARMCKGARIETCLGSAPVNSQCSTRTL